MDRQLSTYFVDHFGELELGMRCELRMVGPVTPGGAPKINNAPKPADTTPKEQPKSAPDTPQAKQGAAQITKTAQAKVDAGRKPDATHSQKVDGATANGSISANEKNMLVNTGENVKKTDAAVTPKLKRSEQSFANKPDLEDLKRRAGSNNPGVRDQAVKELATRGGKNNELIGQIDLKVAVLDAQKAGNKQKQSDLARELPGVVGDLRNSDQKFAGNGRPDGSSNGKTFGHYVEQEKLGGKTNEEVAKYILENPDSKLAKQLKDIEDYARDHEGEGNIPEAARKQIFTQVQDQKKGEALIDQERERLVGKDGKGGVRAQVVQENRKIDEAITGQCREDVQTVFGKQAADLDADVPGDPATSPENVAKGQQYEQQQRLINDTQVFPEGTVIAPTDSGVDASGAPIDGRIAVPVQSGESYWAIAEQYSNFSGVPFEQMFMDIVNANSGRQEYGDANMLSVGDQVILPDYLSERLLNP